ncbi:MFS transporter, partial [Vagococcus salmoninarum]
MTKKSRFRKWLTLFILCLAGGVIYQLPYLRESYYVVMVEVFEVSNTQLGVLMSAFGIVNLLLYIPGGILADRISYKKLIPISLILTSFVGFYYATFPSFMMLIVIHMVFAVTTVFTFWATLIKAVKLLGDSREQGKLFGFLEGGRGLTATIVALLSVLVFKRIGEGALGLRGIIIFYSLILLVLGVLAYFVLDEKSEAIAKREPLFQGLSYALKIPAVWYASGIIFSAYSINGGLTYLTPYLT